MSDSHQQKRSCRILVVEDEPLVRELLADNLEYEGYIVSAAPDLATARHLRTENPDLVIFDVNLPDGDGITELTSWRGSGFRVPVIVCTVKDREIDVIRALNAGADDYVTKPFRIREFLSRIRAILRRSAFLPDDDGRGPSGVAAEPGGTAEPGGRPGGRGSGQETRRDREFLLGPNRIDFASREVVRDGVPINLTATEWNILEYLWMNRNIVVSREQIIEHVWGIRDLEDSRAVDVHLGRLRKKLKEKDPPEFILTVRGLGYRLAV